VVIIENSLEDYTSILEVLTEDSKGLKVLRCEDGEDATEYISKLSDKSVQHPLLIILDLNLPGIGGLDLLEELKSKEDLKRIPVVVFSCSDYVSDVNESYELGANSYIKKPLDSDSFDNLVRLLKAYWVDTISPPSANVK
jgi:two-component system response regulator